MTLFTYHVSVPGMDQTDEMKLILLWKRHHDALGFETRVLSEFHARKHDLYPALDAKIRELPTVNRPEYERACYMRWLAMAQECGQGFMMDYDCFLYTDKLPRAKSKMLVGYQDHVPSLVLGSRRNFEEWVKVFINYHVQPSDTYNVQGVETPHISDMLILAREPIPFERHHVIKNFGEEGWEKAPGVHYSNGSTRHAGKFPRYKHIPELRKL